MSKHLTRQLTLDELISSQEASLVNHSHRLESEKVQKMIDISGLKCLESYKRLSRGTSWGRMFVGYLIGMGGWCSKRCVLTWKLKGTKLHRYYFQLLPSTLPTEEIESGLLPTPMAQSRKATKEQTLKRREKYGGMKRAMYLENYLALGMLPTPVVSDQNAGRRGNAPREGSNPMTNSLKDAINFQEQTSKCSHLNPLFVEEMMGFPKNWTALPFQSGEKKA
jgi:hypothetical protein